MTSPTTNRARAAGKRINKIATSLVHQQSYRQPLRHHFRLSLILMSLNLLMPVPAFVFIAYFEMYATQFPSKEHSAVPLLISFHICESLIALSHMHDTLTATFTHIRLYVIVQTVILYIGFQLHTVTDARLVSFAV